MPHLHRAVQRPLLAATIASVMALVALSAGASANLVDTLWNQPDGVSVDSGWYVVQTWWNGLNVSVSDDPAQRGLDELAQANADLLNAYNLLREQRANPAPQPVPLVDPLVSGIYNALTGSNVSAPIGSFFNWANQGMLRLEGRGSAADIARQLIQDYRVEQAAGLRDLRRGGGADTEALLAVNTQREHTLLTRLSTVSPSNRGLKAAIADADDSTTALAAGRHAGGNGNGSNGQGKDKSSAISSSNGQPKPTH